MIIDKFLVLLSNGDPNSPSKLFPSPLLSRDMKSKLNIILSKFMNVFLTMDGILQPVWGINSRSWALPMLENILCADDPDSRAVPTLERVVLAEAASTILLYPLASASSEVVKIKAPSFSTHCVLSELGSYAVSHSVQMSGIPVGWTEHT